MFSLPEHSTLKMSYFDRPVIRYSLSVSRPSSVTGRHLSIVCYHLELFLDDTD